MNERKKALLYSAKSLFQSQGMQHTSVADITNDCGVSKGSFYQHFPSKESLLLALVDMYHEELFAGREPEDHLLPHRLEKEFMQAEEYRRFLIDLTVLYPPGKDHKIGQQLQKKHAHLQAWREEAIANDFGKADARLPELLFLTDALYHGLLRRMIWENQPYTAEGCAAFITNACRSFVDHGVYFSELHYPAQVQTTLSEEAALLREKLHGSGLEETAERLNMEAQKKAPDSIVLDALLHVIKTGVEKHIWEPFAVLWNKERRNYRE
ncbi:TetR/AcrR family transcriptional regulator [Alkalicoccus urumqiensis]|uniref:HTH tetR-type domain-containing protein n=1 Tax=Alkalicoccus urumqiensis TaxID=1548213 RepID=A0A2P6MGQ5_ALKUR|nr:TetR/AcrR family transcriptional regulator [Alkalicoccus urumqiensis]PRO65453.1 hypothetical protein C6I21_09860 [Alkalicoccus urumqiensis]